MTTRRSPTVEKETQAFLEALEGRHPHEPEFHQAVREVVESVMPVVLERPDYREARVLERLTEPDRVIAFRVCWLDDDNQVQVNRAWRVQFSNAIGPYKGGLRFHSSVNLSVLKFLGFEQIFKNSLTTLPMGGAKGGADFDPKGRSEGEVMRFCQALMTELSRHIGEDVDIPAGDLGVGLREIAFLFGQHKRVNNRFTGTITGKGLAFGGSLIRKEATGYGLALFLQDMLDEQGSALEGRTCVASGSGNVALYAVEKVNDLGGKVVTLSDSDGFVHDPDGIDSEKLEWVKQLKEERRGRIREYADEFGCAFHAGEKPWRVPCEVALPCATQNELDEEDARRLLANEAVAVAEGANMPCTPAAAHAFLDARILYGPGKAANAGGVAVSGLERAQNAVGLSWSREQVTERLEGIMREIHDQCVEHGRREDGWVHYADGANVAGFVKVADALCAFGAV